jgi:hypothetical protein
MSDRFLHSIRTKQNRLNRTEQTRPTKSTRGGIREGGRVWICIYILNRYHGPKAGNTLNNGRLTRSKSV